MEASPHDPAVAYAAAIDLSDRHGPCLLMTSDFGTTWHEIIAGLPSDVPTRVVREDPEGPALLYAGTQAGAYVSFDRGDHWTSLQLNLPRITVNDITVHGTDLAIATWGRGLWILDDVTPLRQMAAVRASTAPVFLFEPATATRVRWDNNHDTPLPPEVPSGQNPPNGAVIDYYLKSAASRLTISIHDGQNRLVREFTSAAPAADSRMPNVPDYWFAPPTVAEAAAGMHRLVWSLRDPLSAAARLRPRRESLYSVCCTASSRLPFEAPRRDSSRSDPWCCQGITGSPSTQMAWPPRVS